MIGYVWVFDYFALGLCTLVICFEDLLFVGVGIGVWVGDTRDLR